MPALNLNSNISLRELLVNIADVPEIPVNGVVTDSRQLAAGDVFLACQGLTSHGLEFVDQAVAAGAAAVVWDSSTGHAVDVGLPMFPVAGLSKHLGEIANRWFDSPSKLVRVSGVTGTNGKTTVASLIQQCRQRLHQKCGYIGTLGSSLDGAIDEGSLTTPACIDLHAQLAEFRDAGAEYAALEVSSHAIEQLRIDGVHFDTAIFTNLSRDHIDYHGGMRAYFETKARLFLDNDLQHRIVSVDDEFGAELADRCPADVVRVSIRAETINAQQVHVAVRELVATPAGFDVSVTTSWGATDFSLPLAAEFNVANAIQVLAQLLCQDVALQDACNVLASVTAPPGRMQQIPLSKQDNLPAVFVDYSHTPASLEAALQALRSHCENKLWCVFGCGGDRDRGKRPMMGQIAADLADHAVVTNDNPRTEVPAEIIADIIAGMRVAGVVIEDRATAIAHAIALAESNDTILIAGKGHEDYQILGNRNIHFSDFEVAAERLASRAQSSADTGVLKS